jgi:predicted RNA-binding Zn-ribbon protein involved in translation (DUF1610 family)
MPQQPAQMSGVTVLRPGNKPLVFFQQKCGQCEALLKVSEDKTNFECPECKMSLILIKDEKKKIVEFQREVVEEEKKKKGTKSCKKCGMLIPCETKIKGEFCYECVDRRCPCCQKISILKKLVSINLSSEINRSCKIVNRCIYCSYTYIYTLCA